MLNRILNKLEEFYATSSSERYISYLRKKGIRIGKGTVVFAPKQIQIDTTRPELVEIGEHVFLHSGTIIQTHDWASWCFVEKYNDFIPSHAKVKIGNNVWLGENVSILKGVTIGNNVIIGLGSIVTKSIPDNSVAVGCPARVVCTIEEYYEKRKTQYVAECVEYAQCIIKSGRNPKIDDFYDDYPSFVDGHNVGHYPYPYRRIFSKNQFENWKKHHKAEFASFEAFMGYVRKYVK